MDDFLFNFILKSQEIDYSLFDADDNIIQYTPGLLTLPLSHLEGKNITTVFPELLIGYEEILAKIKNGEHPPLYIDNIQGTNLKRRHGFISIQIHPYNDGLLVIVRDDTTRGTLEQLVIQRRNELDLMAAQLIDDLRSSNENLIHTYETTLEGWAKALELRDFETKGHSQRVTNLTFLLTQHMGVNEEEAAHYCRGALVHDIGKMGIPDNILLKPGPLTDDEWGIMRQHTNYAYDLLAQIAFLRPALAIPIYHHERWDGSGYPIGLQKEEIPISARIFAVIDVWDALKSDRPYRLAWPIDKVISYLIENKGTQFDPDIVDLFLKLTFE